MRTVGDLIAQLSNYHDETPVLVDGYEDGYDEFSLRLHRVSRVEHEHWWSGRYKENEETGGEVLVLGRYKPGAER